MWTLLPRCYRRPRPRRRRRRRRWLRVNIPADGRSHACNRQSNKQRLPLPPLVLNGGKARPRMMLRAFVPGLPAAAVHHRNNTVAATARLLQQLGPAWGVISLGYLPQRKVLGVLLFRPELARIADAPALASSVLTTMTTQSGNFSRGDRMVGRRVRRQTRYGAMKNEGRVEGGGVVGTAVAVADVCVCGGRANEGIGCRV